MLLRAKSIYYHILDKVYVYMTVSMFVFRLLLMHLFSGYNIEF